MRVGVNWAGGGAGAVDFGAPRYLAVAGFVLAVILLALRFAHGFFQNLAVLSGIVAGYVVTIALGWADLSGIQNEPILRVVTPLRFGLPEFYLVPCLIMCLVMTIVFIEATGMFLALGAMTGRKITADDVTRGLRADSLGTVIGAIFNTFPYVSYSQNIGLVAVTGIYSRWVCVAGGVVMLILGLIPKLAFIVASIPPCVLGGAGFIMFGMVAATGIKILATVDYAKQRNSVLVIAISIGFGLIPIVAPTFFHAFPEALKPIFGDGIILTSIAAVALNVFFNPTDRKQAEADAVISAQAAE
jgi:NCS2 family nucleobase:cation symporter-2